MRPSALRPPLRVGVVGTGVMAERHCRALASRQEVSLQRVVSTARSADAGRALAATFGFASTATDFSAVLDDDIDVVYILTPDELHADQVVAALECGKHVFCEKPLARRADDFRLIAAALRAAGTTLAVGMNCRFRARYADAQALVTSGAMGDLRLLRGTYIQNAVEALRGGAKPWILDVPAGIDHFLHGGALHCLDLMRWTAGEVAGVFARARCDELSPAWPEDTLSVSLEFESGAIGEFLGSAAAFRPPSFALEAWLTGGSIVDTEVYARDGDAVSDRPRTIGAHDTPDLELMLDDFLMAIAAGEAPLNSFAEAEANFRLADAIQRSLASALPADVARDLDNVPA